jgi:hypothetical protein
MSLLFCWAYSSVSVFVHGSRNSFFVTLFFFCFLQILVDVLTKESIVCKLEMLKASSSFVNSRLHAVKAQTLVLAR